MSSAAFSPDGMRIVAVSDDNTARLWDAGAGKPIAEFAASAAAFSFDGKRIFTMTADGTRRLWDGKTGMPIGQPIADPQDRVNNAAFSHDGKHIVTVSEDNIARLWDAESGKPIARLIASTVASSPDGRRVELVAADETTHASGGRFHIRELVAEAKKIAPRCLTPAQRDNYFLGPQPPAWCIEMKKWPYDSPAWEAWLADFRAGNNPSLPSE